MSSGLSRWLALLLAQPALVGKGFLPRPLALAARPLEAAQPSRLPPPMGSAQGLPPARRVPAKVPAQARRRAFQARAASAVAGLPADFVPGRGRVGLGPIPLPRGLEVPLRWPGTPAHLGAPLSEPFVRERGLPLPLRLLLRAPEARLGPVPLGRHWPLLTLPAPQSLPCGGTRAQSDERWLPPSDARVGCEASLRPYTPHA